MCEEQNDDVCFDRLPDPIILLIFNRISDIKTLNRCRAVSTRFNYLVPQADELLLRVDRVDSDHDGDDSLKIGALLRSVFKSIYDLVSPKPLPDPMMAQNSPAQILKGFERIRRLDIELPSGDLRLEKGASIRWSAEFGKTLKSCVILGFRSATSSGGAEADLGGGGLKTRVVWTISALIAASARHYMLKELVKEHKHLERLVVRDRGGEGTVVMDINGLREFRERTKEEEEEEEAAITDVGGGGGVWWRSNRTTVPAVRMRMRHVSKLELSGGAKMMEGATLVVVRPAGGGGVEITEVEEKQQCGGGNGGGGGLAFEAFEGVYKEALHKLLKSRSYLLEMNSF